MPPSARVLVALLASLLVPTAAFGWGEAGHRIVARAAEPFLTSAARQHVRDLLDTTECGGRRTLADGLACASTWADRARHESHPQTYNWHFVDIPRARAAYEPRRDCQPRNRATKGTCLVDGLDHVVAILRDERADATITRSQALLFVIHLIADLHQPLHTILEDAGGNFTQVRYFDAPTNLHQVWDTKLLQTMMRNRDLSERAYARRLEDEIATSGAANLQRGDRIGWVEETHGVAVRDAFGSLVMSPVTRDRRPSLGTGYVEHCQPVVDRQLARAAARLARTLNDTLD